MARRRWSEWASARMLRALVREGAREACTQRRVYTDCGTTCVLLCAWLEEGVQKARSRAGFLHSSARFRA